MHPATPPAVHPSSHPVIEATHAVAAVLKSVADVNPTFMTTPDKAAALRELVTLESQLAELKLRILASAGDVAAETGARDAGAWLAHRSHLRRGDAAADLRLAHTLDQSRAALGDALRHGAVNLEQARVITNALDELPASVDVEVADRAEAALITYAASFDPTALARLGRRILDVVAPEIADEAEARRLADLETSAARRARLRMRALGDGTTRLSAVLPDATAARLATYLHAFTNPRLADGTTREQVGADDTDFSPDNPVETRVPYPRRAADAFCQLLECLDPTRLPIHGGDATTLVVTIPLASLRSELATAAITNDLPGDGIDALTAAQARRLACTAQILPVVLGANSEILNLGRSRRLFTRAQRRALLFRDHRCRAEGCTIPGAWTEAHHLAPWSQGGKTDLTNATLLCSHHHHRAHDPTYRTDRLANGDLRFHRRG